MAGRPEVEAERGRGSARFPYLLLFRCDEAETVCASDQNLVSTRTPAQTACVDKIPQIWLRGTELCLVFLNPEECRLVKGPLKDV